MISISSDNVVQLLALTNNLTGVVVNNATVSASLIDPRTLTTIATVSLASTGSGGNYQGLFTASNTATLVEGQTYNIDTTISGVYNDFIRLVEVAGYN